MAPKHLAITRSVKPGKEAEFETALREFARESLNEPGTLGIHLIGPVSDSTPCEYGILRSFKSEEACEAFYESNRFKEWLETVAFFSEGESEVRELHGLEAFFDRGAPGHPPRWKMAIVTWMGVFPAVLLWSNVLHPVVEPLPVILRTAIVSAAVVVTLAWGVMPFLTKLLKPWLHSKS